ncbi:MAG: hypothetical protein K0Q76_3266 [Panacagrimonas sp.]|jgi:hypothetical protein|nr:hypothetical protein [Panacagrimonas sp.]MCC2658158.1 hypothetical protein [Panacagrimonas sp.]
MTRCALSFVTVFTLFLGACVIPPRKEQVYEGSAPSAAEAVLIKGKLHAAPNVLIASVDGKSLGKPSMGLQYPVEVTLKPGLHEIGLVGYVDIRTAGVRVWVDCAAGETYQLDGWAEGDRMYFAMYDAARRQVARPTRDRTEGNVKGVRETKAD